MKSPEHWPFLFLALVLVAFVSTCAAGAMRQQGDREQLVTDCKATDLYMMQYKGGRSRIYDCSNVDMR